MPRNRPDVFWLPPSKTFAVLYLTPTYSWKLANSMFPQPSQPQVSPPVSSDLAPVKLHCLGREECDFSDGKCQVLVVLWVSVKASMELNKSSCKDISLHVYLGSILSTIWVNRTVLVELVHPKTSPEPGAEACTLTHWSNRACLYLKYLIITTFSIKMELLSVFVECPWRIKLQKRTLKIPFEVYWVLTAILPSPNLTSPIRKRPKPFSSTRWAAGSAKDVCAAMWNFCFAADPGQMALRCVYIAKHNREDDQRQHLDVLLGKLCSQPPRFHRIFLRSFTANGFPYKCTEILSIWKEFSAQYM